MLPLLGLLCSATIPLAAGCPSLVDAAVSGAPGALTALLARCSAGDLVRAVERTNTDADLSAFTRVRQHGSGDVISWKARHSIAWDGTCVAQIGEAIPTADRLPARSCLVDATVRDEYDPNELADSDDDRARFLDEHGTVRAAFDGCTATDSGQACLDRLLPRAGGPAASDPAVADWISSRDAAKHPAPPQPREMHCHAVLADRQSFVVRCEGILAKSICNSESTPIQSVVPPRCASDHSLVVPVSLGEKPGASCLTAVRAALWASRAGLTEARRRALAACARADGDDPRRAVRDVDLSPTVRGLISALLHRQRQLVGPLRLPGGCAFDHDRCASDESPAADIHQRVAQGCGFDVWRVPVPEQPGDDQQDWHAFRGQALLRVRTGARPPVAAPISDRDRGAPWLAIGNTLRQGSLLTAPPPAEKTPATFNDLAAALCFRRGADQALCAIYCAGSQPSDLPSVIADGRWRRVRKAVQKDWPQAYRRFEARQQELDHGLTLDRLRGETRRQFCQPLLIDACTGDVAEICTVTPDEREPPCPGQRLPDGRCQVYRFARLPIAGAANRE